MKRAGHFFFRNRSARRSRGLAACFFRWSESKPSSIVDENSIKLSSIVDKNYTNLSTILDNFSF